MSDQPTGPWIYKGSIMDGDKRSSGNHPGIIAYKGNSYVFGFNYALNYALTNVHRERRSVCLAKLTYNPDGTIQKLPFWSDTGVDQLGMLNPFARNEAETINLESGISTEKDSVAGMYVTNINKDAYIRVRGVDFAKGAKLFKANTASILSGGALELRLDKPDGSLLGICEVKNTGGLNKWITQSFKIKKVKGVHDLYFVCKGRSDHRFNFNWWQFN
jgi:arabinoxylan arabinofuranohydrolase